MDKLSHKKDIAKYSARSVQNEVNSLRSMFKPMPGDK